MSLSARVPNAQMHKNQVHKCSNAQIAVAVVLLYCCCVFAFVQLARTCGFGNKYQGDGFCDDNNNNCGCDWDGGTRRTKWQMANANAKCQWQCHMSNQMPNAKANFIQFPIPIPPRCQSENIASYPASKVSQTYIHGLFCRSHVCEAPTTCTS